MEPEARRVGLGGSERGSSGGAARWDDSVPATLDRAARSRVWALRHEGQ